MSDSGEARISEKENSRTRLSLILLRSNMNSYMRYHAYYKKEQVEQLVTKTERNVAFVWRCRNGLPFEKIHSIFCIK